MKYLILLLAGCQFFWRASSQDDLRADSNQILSMLRSVHDRSLEHRAHMLRIETLMKDLLESGKGSEALQQSISFLKTNQQIMLTKINELENKLTAVPLSHKPSHGSGSIREESQMLLNIQNTLRNMDQNIKSLQSRIPSRDGQAFSIDALNLIVQNHMNRLEQNIYRKLDSSPQYERRTDNFPSGPSSTLILTGKDVANLVQEAFNTGIPVYSESVGQVFDRKLHDLESLLRTFCSQEVKFAQGHYHPHSSSPLELTAHETQHRGQLYRNGTHRKYNPAGIDIVSPPNPRESVEVGKKLKASPSYDRSYLKHQPKDCVDIYNLGLRKNGIYEAFVDHYGQSIPVYCDMDTDGGGWTVVLRRDSSHNPHINFDRPWSSYRNGFGDLNSEFWLGNKYIHALTSRSFATVRIEITDNFGRPGFAEYEGLRIHNEQQKYLLHVGTFSRGSIADEFSSHNGSYFSTPEEDNDRHPGRNCAETFYGGWWFDNCFRVYFNGQHVLPLDSKAIQGIYWGFRFPGNQRLRAAEMKIRSNSFRTFHG